MALQPGHALGGELAELGEEPRLADSGVAEQEEHLAAPGLELVDHRAQALDLGVATDQRRQRAARAAVCGQTRRQASTGRSRPFTDSSPSGSSAKRWTSALRRRLARRRPSPGSADAWSRAATFVVSPTATDCGSACADEADGGLAGVDPDAGTEVGDAPGVARPPAA